MPWCCPVRLLAVLLIVAQYADRGLASGPDAFALTTCPLQAEYKPLAEHPLMPRAEYRELGRQAILLAAREELGYPTRDQTLGERIDEAKQNVFDAMIESRHGQGLRLLVRRGDETVYDHEVEDAIGPVFDIQRLAQKLEPLTRGELADALADALDDTGIERRPNRVVESAAAPAEAEILLSRMDHISQFHALRLLHQAVRETGESPELTGAIARGYANLAMLDVTTMDARSVAYRARAMLYAERLRSRAPRAPETAWTLAYVYALAGYPTIALDSLEAADGAADAADAPRWLEVIVAGCHHNFTDLAAVAYDRRDERAELAAVLLMRSAVTSGSKVLAIETGNECLRTAPGCLWIADAVDDAAGVSLRHRTSLIGPGLHGRVLSTALPEILDLPASIATGLVDSTRGKSDLEEADVQVSVNPVAFAQISGRLHDAAAGDNQEPSWGVLAGDIQAWTTLHLYRRGHFLRFSLDWDAADFVAAMEPAFADDRWAPVLRTLGVTPTNRVEPYAELVAEFELLDANYLSSAGWFWEVPRGVRLKNTTAGAACSVVSGARGATELEYALKLRNNNAETRVRHARWMFDCSKHAPLRIAVLIRDDPQTTDEQVAQWTEEYGDHPVVALALGQRAERRDQHEEAIRHFETYLSRSPDAGRFIELAGIYYRLGDDRWLETLEEILDHEDYALDHARAAVTIAATLLQEGEYDAAATWASRGAESGAAWAMTMDCECRAAQGMLKETVKLAELNSKRYDNPDWYAWCVLTGEGDLEAAWKWKKDYRARRGGFSARDAEFAETLHLWAQGKEQECLEMLVARAEKNDSHWDPIAIAMLAERFGDEALRDKWLAKAAARVESTTDNPYPRLAVLLQSAVKTGSLDKDAIPKIVEDLGLDVGWEPPVNFFAGMYCENRGDNEAAIEYWKTCVRHRTRDHWVRLMAAIELRKAGADPFRVEGRQVSQALWKPQADQ